MSMDILCAVCTEPWDEYGARHGDMAPWEWALFKKGAGCPCCEGQLPAGAKPDEQLIEHLRSVVMESEEPDEYEQLHRFDEPSTRPPWERPPDPVLWTCTGCGAQVRKDIDLTRDNLYWSGSDVPYYPSDEWQDSLAEKPKPDSLLDGKPYCPGCLVRCDDCGELVLDENTYPDPRSCGRETICSACYEQLSFCPQCGELEDDGEPCPCTAAATAEAIDEAEPDDA